MACAAEQTYRITNEAQCWLLTAFAQLERAAELSFEEHQKILAAIRDRHTERIAGAFEAVATSLGDLGVVARRLAKAVRTGQMPLVRRLVLELSRLGMPA